MAFLTRINPQAIARIERIRPLAALGLSQAQIGVRLGVTKNVVAGAIYRHRRSGGILVLKWQAPLRKPRKKYSQRKARDMPMMIDPEQQLVDPGPIRRCTFIELDETRCKYPIGAEIRMTHGVTHMFCGMPKPEGVAFCGYHQQIAYNHEPRPIPSGLWPR